MTTNAAEPVKVDLNQADLETLMTLPGIGEKLAERIIRFRETVHRFEEPVEITAVPGISEQMYREIANLVTALPSPEEAAGVAPTEGIPPAPVIEMSRSEAVAPEETQEPSAELFLTGLDETITVEEIDEAVDVGRTVEGEDFDMDWDEELTEEEPVSETVVDAEEQPPEIAAKADLEEAYYVEEPATVERTNFQSPWISMVLGALLGAVIALALLFVINGGSLIVSNNPKVVELDSQISALKQQEATLNTGIDALDTEIDTLNTEIDALNTELSQFTTLNDQLQNNRAEIEELKQARDDVLEQISTLKADNATLTDRAASMEEKTSMVVDQLEAVEREGKQLRETLDELQLDTGRFDEFLSGLDNLLQTVRETSDSGPSESSEATPASEEAVATPTPTTTPTPTDVPTATRTPRPTRTPTPTPESSSN